MSREALAVSAAVALMFAPAAAQASTPERSTGAPGQQCKALKVKGKNTAAQRAAYKQCVLAAAKARKHQHAGHHH